MTDEFLFYYGSAENKLNSKGQVAIPARFRSVVSDEDKSRNYVITRGEGNCLYMYTHRQFSKIKDNVRNFAAETEDIEFYRRFMAEAAAVEIDTQGRFVLPQGIMAEAGIKGPGILFIGMNDRIEIWEPATYRASMESAGKKYEKQREEAARAIFGI